LLHAAADLYGHFPMRSRIDVEVTKSALASFDEVIVDENGNFHAVAGTQHSESSG